MINHDSELPKDVCVFRCDNYTLCGLPRASSRHDYSKWCTEFHKPLWGCHPFQPAVADPAPVPMPSCTVCHHPMRFHDDPDDGSHWCLACVSRANEKRAAECLEALRDALAYHEGKIVGGLGKAKAQWRSVIARAESILAKAPQEK